MLAGGTENMTPGAARPPRRRARASPFGKAPQLEDSLWSALTDSYSNAPMAITAENLATKYGISREECDAYALLAASSAGPRRNEAGRFKDEIAPIELASARRARRRSRSDEHPRPQTTIESLAKLAPVFKKDGVVTAGNASGICDGAAMLVVTTAEYARRRRASSRSRGSSQWGVAGVDPTLMGIGPAPAIPKRARARRRSSSSDIDLFEVNEAFAPQYLAVREGARAPARRRRT